MPTSGQSPFSQPSATTFHFADSAANFLTNPALDPQAKIPEFKVCAVRVEPVT